MPLSEIQTEDEVFAAEGEVGIGAVREVTPRLLTVYFEGYGDVEIGPEQIVSAHDGKVIVDPAKLPQDLQDRLAGIHDGEYRRPSAT
ncbi:hypothetical protein [Jannaschia rubra]|uniref:hypothetical protein n=1 Tax=Jannaschia rubra TaxID=282197 RepID=UPI002493CF56|nr:hypothetical protein [Jannaschia rubra]